MSTIFLTIIFNLSLFRSIFFTAKTLSSITNDLINIFIYFKKKLKLTYMIHYKLQLT